MIRCCNQIIPIITAVTTSSLIFSHLFDFTVLQLNQLDLLFASSISLMTTEFAVLAVNCMYNFLLIMSVRTQMNRTSKILSNNSMRTRKRHTHQSASSKTMVLVNISLLITAFPHAILKMSIMLLDSAGYAISYSVFKTVWLSSAWLYAMMMLNSGINALVYVIRIRKLKKFYSLLARYIFSRLTSSDHKHEYIVQLQNLSKKKSISESSTNVNKKIVRV